MATAQIRSTGVAVRLNWILKPLEGVLANLFGFLLFAIATSFLAIGIRNLAEWLIAHDLPWLALTFVVLAGATWAGLLSLVRPEHLRNPKGKVLPGAALGFVYAVAAVWIYIFASLSFLLMKLHLVTYVFRGSSANALPNLSDAYLWYIARSDSKPQCQHGPRLVTGCRAEWRLARIHPGAVPHRHRVPVVRDRQGTVQVRLGAIGSSGDSSCRRLKGNHGVSWSA